MLEDAFNDRSKPPNGVRIELVIDSRSIHNAFDPAGVAQHLEVLRRCCLCDRQGINDVTGDAAGMCDQKFHDLEADRIPESFEHDHQSILVNAGNIERATRLRDRFIGSHNLYRIFTILYPIAIGESSASCSDNCIFSSECRPFQDKANARLRYPSLLIGVSSWAMNEMTDSSFDPRLASHQVIKRHAP